MRFWVRCTDRTRREVSMPDEPMDVAAVVELLNRALPLQMRSAILYTWAGASATGFELQAVGAKLEGFGRLELDDGRRLVEKVFALGGKATTAAAPFEPLDLSGNGIDALIELEAEALDALHAVIPKTGQEARSEALEHLLEHVIMRKQEQVDFLERVRRSA